jgi:hypothetical protein
MAPIRPSGPKSPRKWPSNKVSNSSPKSSRIQKKNSYDLVPKPLNLDGTQLLNGLARSNNATARCTNNKGESSDPSDGDEHTSLQVDLSILGAELDEIVNASHAEIQSRINSEGNSPKLAQLSQHLLDSPPSSPHSLQSDGSASSSPSAKTRKAQFQKQKLDELVRQDAEFHRLMNDLVGIRQWWKGNKQEWHEKREEMRNIENHIAALKAQVEQHRRRGWGDKVMLGMRFGSTEDFFNDRWTPQIETLKAQRARILPWFGENRQLMKMVWARVKELEAAVQAEARAKTPDKFFGYPPTDDITKLSWYRDMDKGIQWWLRRAMKNLGTLDGYLQGLLESNHNRTAQSLQAEHNFKRDLKIIRDQIIKDDTEADDQISNLQEMKPQGYKARIAQILNARYEVKLQQRREEIDLEEMVKEVQKRDKESAVITRSLTDHITRNTEFHDLLKSISEIPPSIVRSSPQYRINFYPDLYNLICTHIARTRRGLDLSITLDKIDFSQSKRDKIITLADRYYERLNTDNYFRYLEAQLVPHHGRTDHKSLQYSRRAFAKETTKFTAMIDECTNIYNEEEPSFPKIIDPTHPAKYIVPSVQKITFAKQPPNTPLDISRTIGSTMTLAVAKSILEHVPETQISDLHLPWYELLYLFYTSPDIFPLFRNTSTTTRSWSKDAFLTYTNSLLLHPLERHILEAFLVYCSHTNSLFHITEFRRRVETLNTGWEFVEENSPSGLYRKVDPASLPRPQGLEQVEHALQHYGTYLGAGGEGERKCKEEELRMFLNRVLPADRRVSGSRMKEFVAYWSAVGRFYVLEDPCVPLLPPLLFP